MAAKGELTPRDTRSRGETCSMATIIGGIAASHTPTIGFAFDQNKQRRPGLGADLRGLRAGAATGSSEKKPDVLFVRSTTTTSPRSSSTTTRRSRSASASSYAVADEGGGRARPAADRRRTRSSRAHIGRSLMADEFDMSFFQDKRARPRLLLAAVDAVPARGRLAGRRSCRCRSACCSSRSRRARRCFKLGQALRRAIESYPEDLRWRSSPPAACRTRCTASAPASTTRRGTSASSTCSRTTRSGSPAMTHAEYADARRLRGRRSHHVAGHARRAVGAACASCTSSYYLPSMTGIATAIYENDAARADRGRGRRATARTSTSSSPASSSSRAPTRSRSSAASRAYRAQQVPARPGRAGAPRALPRRRRRPTFERGRPHRRGARPGRAGATGAA